MQGKIDTSEISERPKFQRVRRDAEGRLPPPKSMIREAVTRYMRRHSVTVHRLWQMAQVHSSCLSQSELEEFLYGEHPLDLPAIEALLAATDLRLVSKRDATEGRSTTTAKGRVKKNTS